MRWRKRLKEISTNGLQHGEEIALENCEIPVSFRRHPKARRLTLRVNAVNRKAIVTVPPCCSDQETLNFLEQNINWLYKQFEKLPEPVPFQHGSTLPLRGITHLINFAGPVRGKGVVWLGEGPGTNEENAARVPRKESDAGEASETDQASEASGRETLPLIHVSGNQQFAPRRLKSWLLKEARRDLYARSQWHAENLGLKFRKIMIKDQCTRWGSCSSAGVLSYSWRLILSPPEVLDYVAAHEVAHLGEMNHGPRFWALVKKTMPHYEAPKRWLRQHGTTLHRYDTES